MREEDKGRERQRYNNRSGRIKQIYIDSLNTIHA